MGAMTFDPPVGPSGDARLLSPDYRPLPTKDGYITVGPNTNRQAFAFFDAIGRPELKTDPRFDSRGVAHRQCRRLLRGAQGRASRRRRRTEWVEIFDKLDVPAARYNSIDDLLTDPHLADVGFFQEEDHPAQGRIRRTRARQHLLRRRAARRDARAAAGRAYSRDAGRSRLRSG